MELILETNLTDLLYRGKVRDTYDLSDSLLFVTTDRISAFDSVLPCGIPYKGAVLNQLSAFWFEKTNHIVPNHVIKVIDDIEWLNEMYGIRACQGYYKYPAYLEGRSMIVKKAQRVDIECVVRGYISGSAWSEYKQNGTISGVNFPAGLEESEKLPIPIFTPTTKADTGHDEPISLDEMKNLIGADMTKDLVDKTLEIYQFAHNYALGKGIIIADTKMEFGLVDNKLILIDELLTPDSSRFWEADEYEPGKSQTSFDKQSVRDWLVESGWDKEPPAPMLPDEVITQTSERYVEAFRRLSERELQVGSGQS
ncbi:MAG: phosphoribosylaminoimidazolesuccinocarboxamide synthase [Chloroflexota bacterium]|nr:phosphoribosylaminoimidazolesuccinocarboxamide synthase [Chloroflexota bacterium]